MKYFVFESAGVIDPRSITTFGVSSKDNDQKAIGFFGTGLKYAIAILLRMDCGITIYSGGKKYTFGLFREKIRNVEFDIVTMSSDDDIPQKLGFTTELGKTWEMWQAFRELHCNCADENGASYELDSKGVKFDRLDSSRTYVVVQGTAFEKTWLERVQIILDSPPIAETSYANIHHGHSEWIYYRGIRTHKLAQPALYTYNIVEQMSLTEDRTFKFSWYVDTHVANAIANLQDESMIEHLICQEGMTSWEAHLTLGSQHLTHQLHRVALRRLKAFDARLNRGLLAAMRESAFEELVSDDTEKMTATDKLRLKKSLEFLTKLGHDIQYPIVYSENLGQNVLGRAHNGRIYISQRTFSMGTKMVAGTLLEEYLHIKHGLVDETRTMQNFLFDMVMSLGELVTGDLL